MQSSSKRNRIPHCREYCNGNVAEFYCPECAAMFCSSCYDREHCGNERKAQHGKLIELRAICSEHKHTLDYFNLTVLQPMCVICKKETMLAPDHANHVIEHIETTVPKLRSLMEKKLEDASESIERITRDLTNVENSARNRTNASISHMQCCFAKLRQILDEREAELLQDTKRYFAEFLEHGEGIVEARNTLRNLRALSEEGKLLLNKDARSLVVEFPAVYMRLKELCTSTANECKMKDLKIVIYFGQDIAKQLRQTGIMTAQYSYSSTAHGRKEGLAEENDSTCSPLKDFHADTDVKRHPSDQLGSPCKEPSPKKAKNTDKEFKCYEECSKSPISRTPIKDTGIKRHTSDLRGSPRDEPSCKKARNIEEATGFSEGVDKSSVSKTPMKGVAISTAATTSPSPIKLSKLADLRILLKQSPQRSPVSSPSKKSCMASPRRKRGGELSKEFKKCDIILTEIWAHDESFPFVRPVDKKQSPDYYKVIKKPVDLSIIREKLHSLQYASAVDFVKDIRLMLSNCKLYNQPGSYVYTSGEELGNIVNRLLQENFPSFEEMLLNDSVDGTE